MLRLLRVVVPFCVLVFWFANVSSQEGKKYSIQTATTPIPKELTEPIQKLLAEGSIQMLDPTGKVICDVWFRKDIPADATPEQVKTGVTYREVKQTEILGAIQFHQNWTDYRKQKIKAGVYTMRLGFQPADGKHTADISDFQDFVLVTGAKADTRATLMDPKGLVETSGDSLGLGHPGVFMLWPNIKPGKAPDLAAHPKNHWVVQTKCNLLVGGKPSGSFGIGLTLVGHSPAE